MGRENGRTPAPRTRAKRARKNRRKIDWPRTILTGLLFLLGAECLWIAFHSPRLAVRRIVVNGSSTLTAEQVAALTGIRVGENIFRANLYRARRQIRAAPAIREANVARLLPGTIAITLVEREPRLTLVQGGRFYQVDGEGVVFREISAASAAAAVRANPGRAGGSLRPYFSLRPGTVARLGEPLPRPVVEAALHCVRIARAEGLSLWKLSIDAHDDLWLNVHVAGPTPSSPLSLPIRVGRPQELGVKLADTRKVLQHAPQVAAAAQYLDVSCPRRPAYRVATEDSGSAVALTR